MSYEQQVSNFMENNEIFGKLMFTTWHNIAIEAQFLSVLLALPREPEFLPKLS